MHAELKKLLRKQTWPLALNYPGIIQAEMRKTMIPPEANIYTKYFKNANRPVYHLSQPAWSKFPNLNI